MRTNTVFLFPWKARDEGSGFRKRNDSLIAPQAFGIAQNGLANLPARSFLTLKLAMALFTMLAALASAHGEETQVGRYQMVAVPASQSQTFPEALLLDTATGQTWMLYHETGRAIQWFPLPFSSAKDRPVFLPPPPDAGGTPR
jgi:hypothetical protein